MTGQKQEKTIIHCIGDITLDNHLVFTKDTQHGAVWAPVHTMIIYPQHGGAWFTKILLDRISKSDINYPIKTNTIIPEFQPATFSILSKKAKIWRVEKFIGTEIRKNQKIPYPVGKKAKGNDNGQKTLENNAKIVIIHDHVTYATNEYTDIKEYLEEQIAIDLLILRLSNFSSGSIISHLNQLTNSKPLDNMITFININSLRDNSIHISQGLSWESTFTDLFYALSTGKKFDTSIMTRNLSELNISRYIIITIDKYGCFLIDNSVKDSPEFNLLMIPSQIEENLDFSISGEMFGLSTSIMLHVVKEIINQNNGILIEPILDGLIDGINCVNNVYESGYNIEKARKLKDNTFMIFPWSSWSKTTSSKKVINLRLAKEDFTDGWSILSKKYHDIPTFFDLLNSIVIDGWETKAVDEIPSARIGKFITADRLEIEQYHEIQKLIEEHISKSSTVRPLSIVTLGSQGSGKSFAIKQIAENMKSMLGPNKKIETYEFNLSQFTSNDDLSDAFNKIRDPLIRGHTALVFWDEFDASHDQKEFGWVDSFLSPMQDGEYYKAADRHPIGSPIFIFACSEYENWTSLLEKIHQFANSKPSKADDQSDSSTERKVSSKIIDFASRVHAHVDVMGINPKNPYTTCDEKTGRLITAENIDDTDKPIYVRRSIVLRSILERLCPSVFIKKLDEEFDDLSKTPANIDKLIINMLVQDISEYKYGIRSLESIIQMCHLSDKRRFTLSCIPALNQLKPHIKNEDATVISKKYGIN